MFKKLLLAFGFCLVASAAFAQPVTCATRAPGDSSNACASTAFVQQAVVAGSTPPLPQNQIFVGNSSNQAQSQPLSGDCGITSAGVITCTGSGGVAFGTFAFQNYATPPAIGGTTPAAGSFSSLKDTGITGSTQCVVANSSGVLSGGTCYLQPTTYTTNQTISTANCNSTMVMSNGSLQVTLPSTSGFTAPCFINVTNTDPGRGVVLTSFPGSLTPRLYPNQTVTVFIAGGAWQVLSNPGRWRKAGVNVYVDNVNGNDANDCLATGIGACGSINGAFSHLYQEIDAANGSPTIFLTGGQLYTECVQVAGQLTGVNVGFINSTSGTGTGGGATWTPASSCAGNSLLTISDNAEWEISNIYMHNNGGTSGIFGIHMHQTGVVDVLSGMNFGSFPGGVAIGSDNSSMINMDASYSITASVSTTPTFFSIGSGTVLNECGACATFFLTTPTITTFYAINGSGSTINFGGAHSFNNARNIVNACSVNGLSSIFQAGNTPPGTNACSAGVANGGRVN